MQTIFSYNQGAGNWIRGGCQHPVFRALKIEYSGIEGSQSICAKVLQSYPELKNRLYVGDFLSFDLPGKYDVIVDRASMTHNSTAAIRKGLLHLAGYLEVGGKYIGIDWFSTEHRIIRWAMSLINSHVAVSRKDSLLGWVMYTSQVRSICFNYFQKQDFA